MNAKSFLVYYEQIADAHDAINRMRRLVLDLAVRGKLVPQVVSDEPASELLKRIAKEKAQLIKEGKARRLDIDPVSLADQPFLVHSSWEWTRLGSIGDWGAGSTPSRHGSGLYGGNITWLKSGELNDNRTLAGSEERITAAAIATGSFRRNKPGDVLIAMYGATIGKVAILAEDAVTNQAVCGCTPFTGVFNEFLFLYLLSQRQNFHSASEGGAQPNISKVKIVWTPFPLPPLAEQRRIVEKVDELMTLCDRLEAARSEREALRDRLGAASLARLNTPEPVAQHRTSAASTPPLEVVFQTTALAAPNSHVPATGVAFSHHVRFVLDALPVLTARPDQTKILRQTIRNLAVRGKLVPQDANDEPAADLLNRIARTRAVSNKRKKELPKINIDELGDFPAGWVAAPLIALGDWAIGSGFPKNEQGEKIGPYFFLKVSDMNLPENRKFITTANNFIDAAAAKRLRAAIHPPGTIIFPKIGGAIATNKRRILTRESAIDNNCLGISFSYEIDNEWAYLLLTTLDLTLYQAGTAIPALQQSSLAAIAVAVPPLSEQRRIVAKVDALMLLCDKLEVSLITASDARGRLLDALLAEALMTDEDDLLEAAE